MVVVMDKQFTSTLALHTGDTPTYRQIVLCESEPTPGNFKLAKALPTSAWVTPSLMRRCLKRSANTSRSRGSASNSEVSLSASCGELDAAATAAADTKEL